MVTRNWKAVVQIGGTVAASLPSSARRASRELDRLSTAQRIDRLEANRLGAELKSLRRGTQDYRTALAQQAAVKTRLAERSVRIRELGERAGEATGLLGRFGGTLKSIGPYGAAGAAGVGLLGGALVTVKNLLTSVAEEQRGLTLGALPVGETPQAVDRLTEAFRASLGDAEAAKNAALNFLSVQQKIRQARQGDVQGYGEISYGGAQAGISADTLATGSVFEIAEAFREASEAGANFDRQVAGLRRAGFSDQTIQSVVLMARELDVATKAKENFASAAVVSPEDVADLREVGDAFSDVGRRWQETKRQIAVDLADNAKTFADNINPSLSIQLEPFRIDDLTATLKSVGNLQLDTLKDADLFIRNASDFAADEIIQGGKELGATLGGLFKRQPDAVGPTSQRPAAPPAPTANAEVPRGTSQPEPALPRPTAAIPPEPALPRPTAAIQPEPALPRPTAAIPPEPALPRPTAAIQPEPALPRPTAAIPPEPALPRPTAAIPPEPALPRPTAAIPPEPALPRPTAAIQPEPALPRPTAAIQAAVEPEPAQRPRVPAAESEPAQRPQATAAAAVAQPNVVEQTNNYYIEGAGDPDAWLAAAERSAVRMVRALAS